MLLDAKVAEEQSMSLREDLKQDRFLFTAELNPPKSVDISHLLDRAKQLKGLVSAINITDNSGASMKMAPMAVSHLIERDAGIDAIWQMTCRDRNRLALQSDLLGAWALGLRNVLVLGGDPPDKGDAPETKACFDLKSDDLLKAIHNFRQAKDYDNNPLSGPALDYCAGAAAHPGMPDLQKQSATMFQRRDLGAEFFQTQIVFDLEQLHRFAESLPDDLAKMTLVGITPLRSLSQANFINKNIWGVSIPEAEILAMQAAIEGLDPKSPEAMQKQHELGLKAAQRLVLAIREETAFKGVHVMAIGQEDKLPQILKVLHENS